MNTWLVVRGPPSGKVLGCMSSEVGDLAAPAPLVNNLVNLKIKLVGHFKGSDRFSLRSSDYLAPSPQILLPVDRRKGSSKGRVRRESGVSRVAWHLPHRGPRVRVSTSVGAVV